eukprot:7821841-Pyramimonas_sp.AAC.1
MRDVCRDAGRGSDHGGGRGGQDFGRRHRQQRPRGREALPQPHFRAHGGAPEPPICVLHFRPRRRGARMTIRTSKPFPKP